MTVWQDNMAAFATRPEQAVRAERNQARQKVMALLRKGERALAYRELCASVNRQARISGAGSAQIGDGR